MIFELEFFTWKHKRVLNMKNSNLYCIFHENRINMTENQIKAGKS